MSYTVLARKWRPKNFSELVGQQHVMQALSNALDQQRLHHAYLFTGTRGVGKTTIARIFAKALNCEQGITSKPCGVCAACSAIDEGRFVDLIEVDAASKTKVEDTRELLENVQYAPVQGRYKVYLIDEVHMLSKSSFNALLKTLEEPPEHVKFLLATTDPHKLPITVLSRCLQFNLMRLTQSQIQQHLAFILQQEGISFEDGALSMIAKSADGSARDSLSILDQAIAYSGGQVQTEAVKAMLGLVDQQFVVKIIQALIHNSAADLKEIITQLAQMGINYEALNAQLIEALHQLSMIQVLDDLTEIAVIDPEFLKQAADAMPPEKVQTLYQIALLANQDMNLAPDIRIGFEMSLLRMLAFEPHFTGQVASKEPGLVDKSPQPSAEEFSSQSMSLNAELMTSPDSAPNISSEPVLEAAQKMVETPVSSSHEDSSSNDHLANLKERLDFTLGKPELSESGMTQVVESETIVSMPVEVEPNVITPITQVENNAALASEQDNVSMTPAQSSSVDQPLGVDEWLGLIQGLELDGMAAELAHQSILLQKDEQTLTLSVDPQQAIAKTELALQRLEEMVKSQLGLRLVFLEHQGEHLTPAKYWQDQQLNKQAGAKEHIYQDQVVQAFMNQLNMRIIDKTIEPK